MCCLRNEGYPVGDFENGSDLFLFDDLEHIDPAQAIPIVRNDTYLNPCGERRIAIHYPIVGGFVPLGALRPDGTPHPHAGTGFGLSEIMDFPLLGKGHYSKSHKTDKMVQRATVYQFTYDTHFFLTRDFEVYREDRPLRASGSGGEWALFLPALRQAVPDGDDFLFPVVGTAHKGSAWFGSPVASGISRWQRRGEDWMPVSFVPVVEAGGDLAGQWGEPSLVRDLDGSLLFTSRGCFGEEDHRIRIWRSADNGESWVQIIELLNARGQAPVTINQAADGTPYIVCNKYGHERDWLIVCPLNDERDGLLPPIDVRNALSEFGPPPKGPVWFMDHPNGETVRLADGNWHHLLSYRNMDRGEHAGGAPTPHTGHYLEKLISDGPPRPVWQFE